MQKFTLETTPKRGSVTSMVTHLVLLGFVLLFSYLLSSKLYSFLLFLGLGVVCAVSRFDVRWLWGTVFFFLGACVAALVWWNAWYADQFLLYDAYFVISLLVALYVDYLQHPQKWERIGALNALDREYAGIALERRRKLQELVRLRMVEDMPVKEALRKVGFSSTPLQEDTERAYLQEVISLYKEEGKKNMLQVVYEKCKSWWDHVRE